MHSLRSLLLSTAAGAVALTAVSGQPAVAAATKSVVAATYQHVLLISVDGLHSVDLTNFVNTYPSSNLAALSAHGVTYPNAFTTAPSDSFPGMIAQATGASPKSAGLFYDDSYDRTSYPSAASYTSQGLSDPGCTGNPGAELTNFEDLDKTYSYATGLVTDVTGGGTLGQVQTQLDPTHMQRQIVNGVCTPMYPHSLIHVNTIFEVAKAAGMRTAWSDKHPAYEVLNGPSGTGIDDLFAPEINSQDPNAPVGDDFTVSYAGVRYYDNIKVKAVLNWIDGWDSLRKTHVGTPAIFGMNFQSVSVGQKLAKAGPNDNPVLTGGYRDASGTPGGALRKQLFFVDNALGRMEAELVRKGIADSTLIIISAKHGQSPIYKRLRVTEKDPFGATPGYGTHGFDICDDAALIWLQPESQASDYAAAETYLKTNAAALHIAQLLDRTSLTQMYGDPFSNSRVPDFVAVTNHGFICTGGSKLAEHGGFSDDDRNVALLVSAPGITPQIVEDLTYTTQIAPTILQALGLDPTKLQGVQMEGTPVLTKY